jgi:Skp family chaperone for outer membrane proteins
MTAQSRKSKKSKQMVKGISNVAFGLMLALFVFPALAPAVEIPLESLTPARVGYVDLQKVFDIYPEKAFAEGDLLREIEKRKRELGQRQNLIATIKQQISVDEAALAQGKTGAAVAVPANSVPDLTPPPAPVPVPAVSSSTVKGSTTPVTVVYGSTAPLVEPYPMEDPLAGLPGHESGTISERTPGSSQLPGMKDSTPKQSLLDTVAAGPAAPLSSDVQDALQKRIDANKQLLEKQIASFKSFRGLAIADMKVLETQKTYGVMSKIYAVLQTLARDEGVTVVMDKAYVLYGEDSVDLSDKLIQRLQQESAQ